MNPSEMCALPIMVLISFYLVYVWIHTLKEWYIVYTEEDV